MSDPPLPGSLGKAGRNDFQDYPLGYGPKSPIVEEDPLTSSGELFTGAKGKKRKNDDQR